MSDRKPDWNSIMMALLSGQSGEHASRAWYDLQRAKEWDEIINKIDSLKSEVEKLNAAKEGKSQP